MLCKAESREPGHCLKEGRRVTRCATDLCEIPTQSYVCQVLMLYLFRRITKMRENCLAQFEAHWGCLEQNNQVGVAGFARRC